MLFVEPTVVLPELGIDALIPSIETGAFGSDECHERVTGTPAHAVLLESDSVTLGRAHVPPPDPPPGATGLRRLEIGDLSMVIGVKLIAVTG
ncbi:MAG TPA: hypothetical protein VNN08_05995 [Thermoanaerobaculia bacterium]|nr:hypothetical protein [Thermoanaerobaculia bacterium]